METDNNIWKQAENAISGQMTDTERIALEEKVANDPVFAAELQECMNMLRSLEGSGRQKRFRGMLQDIHLDQAVADTPVKETRVIPVRTHYWRTAGIAASIALVTSISTFWAVNHSAKKSASQYSVLRHELENIKRSQNQQNALINDIKATTENNTPTAIVKYTGTGFAVTNDGYFVTNYHVTEGADSVYIQDHQGKYYKAYVVKYNEQTDVALLKVEKKSFRFGKGDLPYTIANKKTALGAPVFTLGFPEDDITYNEGYISARTGFQGDSMQYRLGMPAKPGQSGAPVIDNNGNIVAIVSGKETLSEGTTYAVSSKALMDLIHSLPKEVNLHLPKVNKLSKMSREQQIEKMQQYTCSVKVYKK